VDSNPNKGFEEQVKEWSLHKELNTKYHEINKLYLHSLKQIENLKSDNERELGA